MTSILFGLATAVFFASGGLMSSRAVKIIGPWSPVAWTMVVGMVVTLPFLVIAGIPDALAADSPFLLAAGLGNVGGLVLTGFAFRVGKVGVVTPIVACEGAISAVLAAMTGQSIAPVVALFLVVVVGGIVIAGIAPDPAPLDHERPALAVILATGGAICFGVSLFCAGFVSGDLPIAWVLLPARLVGVLFLAIPLAAARNLRLTQGTLPLVIGMGFSEVIGFTCFTLGAQYNIAVTSVLASQFAPIAAVMAYVL